MIKAIRELNFPKYATLSHATVNVVDMGENTITTQVKIDGEIAPDFSYDWEIEFNGEKYIHPVREPQGAKGNTSLNASYDLTFIHKCAYELQRYFFVTLQPTQSGTAIADKYEATISLNLRNFCELFNQVLNYYYGAKISLDLNPKWSSTEEPSTIEISYSHIWDILLKFHEIWGVRWHIESPAADTFIIKVGYPAEELDHILEYGFSGGLLKVERQVQPNEMANILLGRGGEKNIPYRYFKDADPDNPSFLADPDWIPELSNITFDRLRDKSFRDYVKGWKFAHYNGQPLYPETQAYKKGKTDKRFDPIEYVKADGYQLGERYLLDKDYIQKYGELWGGLDNNDEIYPSIQGITVDPFGRIDQIVAVEEIKSDDVEQSVKNDAQISSLKEIELTRYIPNDAQEVAYTQYGDDFFVEEGKYANVLSAKPVITPGRYTNPNDGSEWAHVPSDRYYISSYRIYVRKEGKSETHSATGIPTGHWRVVAEYTVKTDQVLTSSPYVAGVTISTSSIKLQMATPPPKWNGVFNVWIKNIWQTEPLPGELSSRYAERVWGPILGDRTGNEAKVIFSSGLLSVSEDYEFIITEMPVYDTSQSLDGVPSHWRLSLGKSDAELQATGLYLPNTKTNAMAGDYFHFVGIDMPHQYVLWAERDLHNYKTDQLERYAKINPTWVVALDRIRASQPGGQATALIDKLIVGSSVRIADKRFIEGSPETLYIQSITYTFREPTSDDAALNPDVEIVLADKYMTGGTASSTIQEQIDTLSRQIGSLSNIEQVVRAIGDKLYLRKDGLSDRSMSPTQFSALVTSSDFRQGIVGGQGWGIYRDANGNVVFETDRANIRQDVQVNNLVVNQVIARGGMIVESAASMEITRVVETSSGYICYFDQKQGSVANLFRVDDVAYCNRFSSINKDIKFYKRRIIAADAGSVTLTKGYLPVEHDGTVDTGVNGDGIPSEGDVIVHYGNYYNKRRQYVKVRDVIGGGYERYIEGLNSVDATGIEYYFVGRQEGVYGDRPRWYIGDNNGFLEWVNGKLNIKGSLSVQSTIGDKPIDDYISDATTEGLENLEIGGENLVRRSAERISNANYSMAQYTTSEDLATNSTYTFTIWGTIPDGKTFRIYDSKSMRSIAELRAVGTGIYSAVAKWKPYSGSSNSEFKVYSYPQSLGGIATIDKIKVEKGNIRTDWSPSSDDIDYLKSALKETTNIDGGVILTSLIRLGYTSGNNFKIMSGLNGIFSNSDKGNGLAFWAGGENIDAAVSPSSNTRARFGVRMDGTGYAADNTVRFEPEKVEVGDWIHLEKSGLRMNIDGQDRMELGNYKIPGAAVLESKRTFEEFNTGVTLSNTTVHYYKYPTTGTVLYWLSGSAVDSVNGRFLADYPLGRQPVGTSLSVNISITMPIVVADTMLSQLSGGTYRLRWLVLYGGKIYRSGTVSGKYKYAGLTFEFSTPTDGLTLGSGDSSDYTLRFLFINGETRTAYADRINNPSPVINCKGGAFIPPSENKTTLGNDGMMVSWGDTRQVVQAGLWGARVGSYGIKIQVDGIYIMSDGEHWTPLKG